MLQWITLIAVSAALFMINLCSISVIVLIQDIAAVSLQDASAFDFTADS